MDEIKKIEDEIKKLKECKRKIINESKKRKNKEIKNQKNILRRMSTKFHEKMDFIDEKRVENGMDILSLPEKTDLIIRHKDWFKIEDDIVHFNKKLTNNGGILNACR